MDRGSSTVEYALLMTWVAAVALASFGLYRTVDTSIDLRPASATTSVYPAQP